jgi:hypothetical protein
MGHSPQPNLTLSPPRPSGQAGRSGSVALAIKLLPAPKTTYKIVRDGTTGHYSVKATCPGSFRALNGFRTERDAQDWMAGLIVRRLIRRCIG